MKSILVAGCAISLALTGTASAVEVKVSHSSQASLSSELHTAAWAFQNYLEDFATDFNVTIYPNNQLGQEREVYEAMQLGSGADCAISGTAILGNFDAKLGVVDLPYLWRDYDHVHRVLDGEVGDALAEGLRDSGFEIVAWLDSWGYRNVATTKPINSAEDLKGLKIRTIPTNTYVKTVNAMGANATPMAFGEIYTAMETGVLDGLEHSAALVYSTKFYEVTDYYTLTRHFFGPVVFVCSNAFMSRLDDSQKEQVMEAAAFAGDLERALAPVREQDALAALADAGMTIGEIDITPLREATKPVQDELAAEIGATDILEQIRSAAEAR
ncbi:TRAP transporter substrate-binding protein [Roseospira visakhapatnamensis]|uniref:Tripartite ATP-independent transporter DctP family solute receptor n=1 Tax=Roseospira visakhapatnamensis TaxID=390880 RepID=A0A7W6RDM9_9PROT|nr:TRAP transporter substrate-binding protein [Roseospira visakhapatnamensis]MBB4266605.1 tripartite ATP-independent transporter DctP family solute receptor [Roseospira visakhapatnamensis]